MREFVQPDASAAKSLEKSEQWVQAVSTPTGVPAPSYRLLTRLHFLLMMFNLRLLLV